MYLHLQMICTLNEEKGASIKGQEHGQRGRRKPRREGLHKLQICSVLIPGSTARNKTTRYPWCLTVAGAGGVDNKPVKFRVYYMLIGIKEKVKEDGSLQEGMQF